MPPVKPLVHSGLEAATAKRSELQQLLEQERQKHAEALQQQAEAAEQAQRSMQLQLADCEARLERQQREMAASFALQVGPWDSA